MAAPVSHSRFPLPAFRQDPHWMKFKATVAACDKTAAARFLEASYRDKPIERKLDQFFLELIDERKAKEIVCLAAAMKETGRNTELARISRLGAAILLNDGLAATILLYRHSSLTVRAAQHASEFRAIGWEGRALFMDSIAAYRN